MEENVKKRATKSVAKISKYHNVFNSREGSEVLYDMMATHGMITNMFPANGDVNQLIYNEGARSVVLRILTLLKQDPKKILERIEQYENEND